MISKSIKKILGKAIEIVDNEVVIKQSKRLQSKLTDDLVWKAVFGNGEERAAARWIVWQAAQKAGVKPSSINDLYMVRGRERVPLDFTVPAMNLRGMAYDMARAVFSQVKRHKVGAFILELARSEMGYTDQPPSEYATVMLAAGLREGYRGPVFIQGDHFQTKVSDKPGEPRAGEIEAVKQLIAEAVDAGFYNIDIDTSTLVDLSRRGESRQQAGNVRYSLELAEHVRALEPSKITISLGGEIGHIGGKNSTVEDFRAYMDGFNKGKPRSMAGLSKVSVQTGTSHGGVVLADGSLAEIDVDFGVLRDISKIARKKYRISGAVQHGASTLPDEYFAQFAQAQAVEVHLATGFQNIMIDHASFPEKLRNKMYQWLDREKSGERKEGWTDDQFHYKLRKKAWGEFKKQCWSIDGRRRAAIRRSLEERFGFMFRELNVVGTRKLVDSVIKPVRIDKKLEDFSKVQGIGEVKGLAD